MHTINCIILSILLISQWSSISARPFDQHSRKHASETNSNVSNDAKKSEHNGLTWDSCRNDNDCVQPRTCRKYMASGESKECNGGIGCVCDASFHDFETCTSDDGCDKGEFCFIPFEGSVGSCFSKTGSGRESRLEDFGSSPVPESNSTRDNDADDSDADDDGNQNITETPDHGSGKSEPEGPQSKGQHCIGVHMLSNLSRDSLIYRNDVEALVLCDRFDSCATAGHVVIVNGTTMMMSNYCMVVGCQEKVMFVNNPKDRRVRIRSRSYGLVFTGYSARYETRLEEGLFRLLTALGL